MFRKSAFNPVHQKSALYLEKQRCWKNSANSALCSNVGLDMTTPFKLPAQKKLKISEKLVEKQRKCAQISPLAFLSIEESAKMSRNQNPYNYDKKNFRFFSVCALHRKKNLY